ncbi:hypothetical protein CspeluHIS016_0108020 [Cutaneotrichosporon spelunceum]|uniref:Major facilitator superfamily (MFS) profile domain-containing protein n=1 Tax=Cutaneotrichosporon spelunceum TaxID=1672016 RepID=A0AAD3Y8M0_9TREE|nr:hypothetical protein CspeluHIS016_0108020 [Cutaneotrichosporon spelunceum]
MAIWNKDKNNARDGDVEVEIVRDAEQGQKKDDMFKDTVSEAPYVYTPGTDEERRLVRKIDMRLFPMLWVMFCMNYLDRTNIGNAKVGGMAHDLKLTSSQYSLVLSVFFIGYLLWEVPSNMMLSRSTPRIFVPTLMVVWGAMCIAVVGINNLGGMIAFRFVLGLVEAGFFPGIMLVISCWYKPEEMSKRVAGLYSATMMAGAFGGLLAGGLIEGMEGIRGIRGWKWMFIIEGIMTVAIALIGYIVLPNYPLTTPWLSEEEKTLAIARLIAASGLEVGDEERLSHWDGFKASVSDPITWVMLVLYNMLSSVGTISYFFPSLLETMGYQGHQLQFMTVPIYVVAMVVGCSAGVFADRTGMKAYTIVGGATLSVISFIICASVNVPQVRYAFICFGAAGIWTNIPIFLSWMVTMFDGREKRAVSIALVNGFGNLASVYGSFFWPSSDAPNYTTGFAITTALCGSAGLLALATKWKYGDKGVEYTG